MMESKRTLLYIDDDSLILKAVRQLLADEPYEIFTTSSCEDALNFVQNNPVDLIMSDYHMIGFTGFDFFSKMNEIGNKAARVLITGSPGPYLDVGSLSRLNICKVIIKPWENDDFKKLIREALPNIQTSREF
jgi:response regulator RpfG family c-di-GMP phosphodiesterase